MGDRVLSKLELTDFESIKRIDEEDNEYWFARELMPLLEYTKWQNFHETVIQNAIESCKKSGQSVQNHFTDISKMVDIGSNTQRSQLDYKLSRYACYLIAQNGDPRKKAIALAQTYFAIQARRQELLEKLSEDEKRLFIRNEVTVQNKQLFNTAKKAGVKNFAHFNEAGYQGLYGMTSEKVKEKKQIGKDRIIDRAGATELAANLFRITQTDEKINRENTNGEGKATFAHRFVGRQVRDTMKKISGVYPEDLPSEQHIKKINPGQQDLLNDPD
ncbi:MAG: DNA damage-inducible protein D [Patescibacteria group bacterium]